MFALPRGVIAWLRFIYDVMTMPVSQPVAKEEACPLCKRRYS